MKHAALPLALAEDSALIVEGSVSATLVALLQVAVLRMIPYAVPGLLLVVLDLAYGIKAAKARRELVRVSTAIRRSLTKVFLYICWLILATTIAIAFGKVWLEWGTLAMVYGNEALSIIGNYFETKGLQFSFTGAYRWILRVLAGKVGADMSDEDAGGIIKPAQPRNAKGQFAKKED